MTESQSPSQRKIKLRNPTVSKRIEIDKDDALAWMGLAILSTYFGYSIEQTMNRTLNPEMNRLANDLRTYLQDQ